MPTVSTGQESVSRRPQRSLLLVLLGTAVSGASGFLTLLIVAPALGATGYASFSLYWAALFMLVGVLFGVQQETTRAVANAGGGPDHLAPSSSVARFAGTLAVIVLILLVVTAPLWSRSLFGEGNADWALPLACGVASYIAVAAMNGILAGSGRWGGFAAVSFLDGLLRLGFVVIALWAGADGTALAWAVALPFPLSLLLVGTTHAKTFRVHGRVRETYRAFAANASRTIVASTATAVLITGFPLILSVVGGDDRGELGVVVLALTLARAPILVPLTVLQSMLIARFSVSPEAARRLMLTVIAGILIIAAVLGTAAGIWGPGVLVALFGTEFAVDGLLLFGMVAASACLGLLTVTGARVLALGKHTLFAGGWVTACVLAVAVVLLTPADIGLCAVLGLVTGPLVGVGCHILIGRRT